MCSLKANQIFQRERLLEVLTAAILPREAEGLQKLQTQLTGGRGKASADFTEPPILSSVTLPGYTLFSMHTNFCDQLMKQTGESTQQKNNPEEQVSNWIIFQLNT